MSTAPTNLTPFAAPKPRLALAVPYVGPAEPLRRAFRRIPEGGRDILSVPQWTALGLALRFSPRELQIVQAVFDDLKESAIADTLGISAHTVHTHLERLYRKLGVRGRSTMIIRIFAEQLRLSAAGNGV